MNGFAQNVCTWVFAFALMVAVVPDSFAQNNESGVELFGYFQPQFVWQHHTLNIETTDETSFVLQQVNLFFRKKLSPNLTSFVNLEAINSYSSRDGWGEFRIEEAWVMYRAHRKVNIKLGLQIPIFNHFNEIRNRMPLIPYVIRPLVYESSLQQVLHGDMYVPRQAFVQLYAWVPIGRIKLDYATFAGNTQAVNSDRNRGQTGVDTTNALLAGTRIGIRVGEFKIGLTNTVDRTSAFTYLTQFTDAPIGEVDDVTRYRHGADVSFYYKSLVLEGEWISVDFDNPDVADINLDFTFLYGTIGYAIDSRLYAYFTYAQTREDQSLYGVETRLDVGGPSVGVSYLLEDVIALKAQYAHVTIDLNNAAVENPVINYYTVAVTVSF